MPQSRELSAEAKKIVVRLIYELGKRMDRTPACYEAGLEICLRVFGCVPVDLPDYKKELKERDQVKSRSRTIASASVKEALADDSRALPLPPDEGSNR